MVDLIIGRKYNFTTKYPDKLGGKFKNMKLEAANMSSTLAVNYGDIHVIHQRIKASASEFDPVKDLNVDNLTWMVFLNIDTGKNTLLALEYLDTNSIAVSGDSYKFMVSDISATDVGVIKKALAELGYSVDELE